MTEYKGDDDVFVDIQIKCELARVMTIHPSLNEHNPYLYLIALQNLLKKESTTDAMVKKLEEMMIKAKTAYDAKNKYLVSQFMDAGATRIEAPVLPGDDVACSKVHSAV